MILADMNNDGVTAAAKELGKEDVSVPMQMDVTNEQHWADVSKLALDKFGRIDILVNNGIISDLLITKYRLTYLSWDFIPEQTYPGSDQCRL